MYSLCFAQELLVCHRHIDMQVPFLDRFCQDYLVHLGSVSSET
jgi:hypothetical protein